MVACHLLKAVHYWRDAGYGDYELWYFRDRDKREVDFIITHKRKPVAAIECKNTDVTLSPSLCRFATFYRVPLIQLVDTPKILNIGQNSLVSSAHEFLVRLP